MTQNKKWWVRISIIALVLFCSAAGILFQRMRWPSVASASDAKEPVLHAAFFAVGQGDATLLRDVDGNDILIDGGPTDAILSKLGSALPPTDRTIELVVLTHPHADHVNGLAAVLARYHVDRVLMTGVAAGDGAYAVFQKSIAEQHIPVTVASTTFAFDLGRMHVDVLWPQESWEGREPPKDNLATGGGLNDTSIVLSVSHGKERLLFMGDASSAVEEALLHASSTLTADILKVGHHGSKYSTSRAFLAAVQPSHAVIEVGAKNRYKHPTLQALARLGDAGVRIFRTDQDGDVRVSMSSDALSIEGECGRDPCGKR
ncbi:MBL fold metallo-hydrolase [Patescibacteria group bacterium]|nr:MBL fold metallo-hydrolase [Patescibacteria group bacterium]